MLNNQGFEELAYKKMFMDAKTTLGILKIKYLVLITKKRQENKEWTAIGMTNIYYMTDSQLNILPQNLTDEVCLILLSKYYKQ